MTASGGEMRAFVFAVSFIVLFSVLLSTIPADLQGSAATPDMVIPVDPSTITGFSATEDYQKGDFSSYGYYNHYVYPAAFASRYWIAYENETIGFWLGAKILFGGFLWLGALDYVTFINPDGVDRGEQLGFDEIEEDAEDGVVMYVLKYVTSGAAAGNFIVYWNTTANGDDPLDAWDADELFLVHGIGFDTTAAADIGSLLVQLLLLQLPDVPVLVNVLLVVPIWASVIFLLWFIIKETMPFV